MPISSHHYAEYASGDSVLAGLVAGTGSVQAATLLAVGLPTTLTGTGTVLTAVAVRAQIASPDGDQFNLAWQDQVGGTTNLYTRIDELSFDDSDYITATLTG